MRSRKIVYTIKCLFFIALIFHVFSAHISRAAVVAMGVGLSANPQALNLPIGGSGQSIITVSGKGNPVPWLVDLSASTINGISTLFDPDQVTIQPSNGEWHQNESTLTISVDSSATPGVMNLTVTADFGLLSRTVNITLTIEGGGSMEEPVGGMIVQDASPINPWICVGLAVPVAVVAAINIRRHPRNRSPH